MARTRRPTQQPRLYRVEDAANILSLSRRGIYALLAARTLTRIKFGRATRIDAAEVEALIEAARAKGKA